MPHLKTRQSLLTITTGNLDCAVVVAGTTTLMFKQSSF